jgi:hypothetical protein
MELRSWLTAHGLLRAHRSYNSNPPPTLSNNVVKRFCITQQSRYRHYHFHNGNCMGILCKCCALTYLNEIKLLVNEIDKLGDCEFISIYSNRDRKRLPIVQPKSNKIATCCSLSSNKHVEIIHKLVNFIHKQLDFMHTRICGWAFSKVGDPKSWGFEICEIFWIPSLVITSYFQWYFLYSMCLVVILRADF